MSSPAFAFSNTREPSSVKRVEPALTLIPSKPPVIARSDIVTASAPLSSNA